MDLQTRIEIGKSPFAIGYQTGMMAMGSCFAENIGAKLTYFKFDADVNPCGIIYNPFSIANVLKLLIEKRQFAREDLLQYNGKWISLYHHGSFSSAGQPVCLQHINERLSFSSDKLRRADLLFLTFGTAWVYRHRQTGLIVSNCHKIPSSEFEHFRLSVREIVLEYATLIDELRCVNPNLKILFTVSPIRHWKNGAHGNQLSKSVLLLAIDELVDKYEHCFYFPSYEIVMDELRDYRFYGEDMLHLSGQAIHYIWERFKKTYMEQETVTWMDRIDKLNKKLLHKPFDTDNPEYKQLQETARLELAGIQQMLSQLRSY